MRCFCDSDLRKFAPYNTNATDAAFYQPYWAIITNKHAIAINQDIGGVQGICVQGCGARGDFIFDFTVPNPNDQAEGRKLMTDYLQMGKERGVKNRIYEVFDKKYYNVNNDTSGDGYTAYGEKVYLSPAQVWLRKLEEGGELKIAMAFFNFGCGDKGAPCGPGTKSNTGAIDISYTLFVPEGAWKGHDLHSVKSVGDEDEEEDSFAAGALQCNGVWTGDGSPCQTQDFVLGPVRENGRLITVTARNVNAGAQKTAILSEGSLSMNAESAEIEDIVYT